MKKTSSAVFTFFIIASFSFSQMIKEETLIFPHPQKKFILVEGLGMDRDLLSGQEMPQDTPLSKAIFRELDEPYHQSIIKLVQCSRNLVFDTKGPNVLYLSETEGGFPRQGLILKTEE